MNFTIRVGLGLLLACLAGCASRISTPPRNFPDQGSPESVLRDMEQVYATRDTAEFRRLCAPEYWSHALPPHWYSGITADSMGVNDDMAMLARRFGSGDSMPLLPVLAETSVSADTAPGHNGWVVVGISAFFRYDTLDVRSHAVVRMRRTAAPDSRWVMAEWAGASLPELAQSISPYAVYKYRDEEPVLVHLVAPTYPDTARARGIQGKVVLNVLVATDGTVATVQVQQGVDGLNEAAKDAVRQYQFVPALAHGRPISVWVAVPIQFTLKFTGG